MGGLRSKFIILLIMYFAGFATAIYTLAPVPEGRADARGNDSFASSVLNSDKFAESLNTKFHQWFNISKSAAAQASKLIEEKARKENPESGG